MGSATGFSPPGGSAGPTAPASVLLGTYASRPAPSSALPTSRLYLTSDGPVPFADAGDRWQPMVAGVLGEQVPAVADWTDSYGPDDVWTDQAGTVLYTRDVFAGGAQNVSGRAVALPGANFRVTAAVRVTLFQSVTGGPAGGGAGLVVRDSVTGQLAVGLSYLELGGFGGFVQQNELTVGYWDDPLTFNTDPAQIERAFPIGRDVVWMRVEQSSGNRVWSASVDGVTFSAICTTADNDFLAPDQVGFCIYQGVGTPGNAGAQASILSLALEAL
jgi:hypothetical protein